MLSLRVGYVALPIEQVQAQSPVAFPLVHPLQHSIINIVLHDAIAIAYNGSGYGWAAQVFKCFAEHGKSIPLVAGAPVEVQPDELQLSFQMQQQAVFDAVPLDPRSCPGPGLKLCTYRRRVSSSCTSGLPSLLGSPHEHCKVAEDFELSHGVSFAAD